MPAVVFAGQNLDAVRADPVVESEGETAQQDTADVATDDRPAFRHGADRLHGLIDLVEKLAPEPGHALFVEARRFADFGGGGRVVDDPLHSFRRSWRIASSWGRPWTIPRSSSSARLADSSTAAASLVSARSLS